jgi:hypothetical protein
MAPAPAAPAPAAFAVDELLMLLFLLLVANPIHFFFNILIFNFIISYLYILFSFDDLERIECKSLHVYATGNNDKSAFILLYLFLVSFYIYFLYGLLNSNMQLSFKVKLS